MTKTLRWALTLLAAAGLMLSCDSDPFGGEDDAGSGGTWCNDSTCCDFPFGNETAGKVIGERCTADSECAFGKCYLPTEPGNQTNDVFGFCTRGCDCEASEEAKLTPEEKNIYICYYPTDGQGTFKQMHHVVLRCDVLDECTAVDSGYNLCSVPKQGTSMKVCQAR